MAPAAARRSLSEPHLLGRAGHEDDENDARPTTTTPDAAPSRCPFARASAEAASTAPPSSSSSRCPFARAAAKAAASLPSAPPPPSSSSTPPPQHQQQQHPWLAANVARLRRPTTDATAARLSRRALRSQNRAFSLAEVAQHRFADDGWIAVSGRVFDITEHVVSHKGWDSGCGVTEVLSILAHLGSDCTSEFNQIHACYPIAFAQLKAYDIGPLEATED